MKKNSIWTVLAAICVSACGGGGGGSSPPPVINGPPPPPATVLSGQFKDGNVSGLSYSTPNESGATDTMGRFNYRSGEMVEFSIGGVVIGSAPGQPIVTPVNLVPGGSADSTEVLNIVRFLLMLDEDEDPANGIAISQAVRDVAANWTQVDFSTSDLGNELATIISDVASVDNRTAMLPGGQAAASHLAATTHCAMSGFFTGGYTGDREGTIVLLINPVTGLVLANFPGSPTEFESEEAVSVDNTRGFNAVAKDGSGDNFEGRFDSYDEISGVWSIGADTGEFAASRVASDTSAAYRFTGQWFRDNVTPRLSGPMVLNVDASGNLTGNCADITSLGLLCSFAGTFDGQDFAYDVRTSDGDAAGSREGTVDESLYVEGTGTNLNGSQRPWFAQGCRLN